ncbi:hypothetical protein [Pseudomonas sp. C11]|uniref:hypothetical protein n=1 Tax=Pseudomonas sp. C11 TaxID=3075550 RepID=UPI002AFEC55B|nr:hypothetical protein [Pseudomonas sp. C11]
MNALIKVFPDSIFTVDDAGGVSMIERHSATFMTHVLRWGWLVLPLAFIASWRVDVAGLTVTLFCLLGGYPLIALVIANWIFPDTTYEAHFDAEGLHLAIGQAQDLTAHASIFVPYREITELMTLDHYRDMGRYGTTWFRSYIIKTKVPYGEKPHLKINTKRSAESVYSVLNRVAQLPAAQHIRIPPMITIGDPPFSPARRREQREERERRLRGEV